MKKRYLTIPAALSVVLGVCVFCKSRDRVPADEKIDLVMRAKNFVRRLNRREYENCCEMFGETMAESNPVEKLRETFDPIVDSLGDFLCFRNAAVTKKKDYIYQAAMLDPHTAAELTIDQIVSMCDDLIEAHKGWLPEYH